MRLWLGEAAGDERDVSQQYSGWCMVVTSANRS